MRKCATVAIMAGVAIIAGCGPSRPVKVINTVTTTSTPSASPTPVASPSPAPTPSPSPSPSPSPTPSPTPSPAPSPAPSSAPLVLIKGSLELEYYVSSGKRYVFPNGLPPVGTPLVNGVNYRNDVFFSWYADKSQVTTISDQQLATIPEAGDCHMRAGTYILRNAGSSNLYWITNGGVLREILRFPDDANTLVGNDIQDQVIYQAQAYLRYVKIVPDAFWTSYTIGAPLVTLIADGMLYRKSDGGDIFLVDNGVSRKVAPEAMIANGFREEFVHVRTDVDIMSLVAGADLTDGSYAQTHTPAE